MEKIITEIVIPMKEGITIFSPARIELRIKDYAAGPFLEVLGYNDDPDDPEESMHAIYFENAQQIDDFAEICKTMLANAKTICTTTKKEKL